MAEQGGVRVRAGSVTASVQDQPASSLQKSYMTLYRGTDFLVGNLLYMYATAIDHLSALWKPSLVDVLTFS